MTGCSDDSAAAGERLAGSAPQSVAWVALEQNGPWGAKAFTASHLDPVLGRAIEVLAAEHEARPALIRRPGPHPDRTRADHSPLRVLVAHTRPGGSWLLDGLVGSPGCLLDLDWAALARGDAEAVRRSLPGLAPSDEPQLLVCTNGRRDVCCASKGRPVALGAAAAHPRQVWEVTHTSGHRFAPTAVLLPAGTLHGRLDVASAGGLLRAAGNGETVLPGSRGRSTWAPPAQAAELAVREHERIVALDALAVTGHEATGEHAWRTVVAHTDGRAWEVLTEAHASSASRPESCGKALKPVEYLTHVVGPRSPATAAR